MIAAEAKYGEQFVFEGETFMRVKSIGVSGFISIVKHLEAHKIVAVSMRDYDLIVIDGQADVGDLKEKLD